LKENETLTHMDVSRNEISDIGGIALAKALGMYERPHVANNKG